MNEVNKITATQLIKEKIKHDDFIRVHKTRANSFTRNRILTFQMVFLQILRKTVKSLQVSLNELFMDEQDPEKTVEKMEQLFKTNPTLRRVGREPPIRKKPQIYNHIIIKKETKNMFSRQLFLNLMAMSPTLSREGHHHTIKVPIAGEGGSSK
jgi:hypothetical protein